MSTNERWVVYPLLFLSLGVAVRDKLVPQGTLSAVEVRCNRLRAGRAECDAAKCRELEVGRPNRPGGVRLDTAAGGSGRLQVRSAEGKTLVGAGGGADGRHGSIATFDADGSPQVRLFGTRFGGVLATFDRRGHLLVVGRFGPNAGLWGFIPQLGHAEPLSRVWEVEEPQQRNREVPR